MKSPEGFIERLGASPKILLIRLRSLGDVVLMTPLAESIRRTCPGAQIDVAVEFPFNEVLAGNPFIRRSITLQSKKNPHSTNSPSVGQPGRESSLLRRQAIWNFRQEKYDVVWNLHGGATSAWMCGLSGGRWRIGCTQFRNRWAYNLRVPDSRDLLPRPHHTVERLLLWWDWLRGVHRTDFSDDPSPQVFPQAEPRRTARTKMHQAGLDPDRPYVVIQAAAVFATKEWMADRFATVADFLSAKEFQIALTGSSGETSKLRAVQSRMKNHAALLSNLGVQELIAVLEKASLYLGNDSGPAHIAAALKRPTVVLFGSSNSAAWAPWHAPSVIVQNHFECNPCPGYKCLVYNEPECIKSITVPQVQAAVLKLLFPNREESIHAEAVRS
ncbi:MAG: glycosyltransferase family 9 protein [Acidobacteriia bacterium]|nr:glycosyltransferase family 9 protein [Terriglobia bacterium]